MTESEMTLLEHITELRARLFRVIIVWIVATVVATFFVEDYILTWLFSPIKKTTSDIQSTIQIVTHDPTEGAVTYFKLALIAGFSVALPYIFFEIYGFLKPGLLPHERKTFAFGIPAVMILFVTGAVFTVEVLLPPSMGVLSGIFSNDVQSQYSLQRYLSFFSTLVFWMGLIFQTPLIIYIITLLGAVTPKKLLKAWRAVLLLAAVAAAVITPTPDPLTMSFVMAPFFGLYLIGIVFSYIAMGQRKRKEQENAI